MYCIVVYSGLPSIVEIAYMFKYFNLFVFFSFQ